MGNDQATGQPITLNSWIDRLAPKALAVVAAGTCATYGGIHAMDGNPTGCMGLADYLGWNWRSQGGLADRQCSRLSGAARQLHGNAALSALPGGGAGADDSARRTASADLALRQDRARRLRPGGYYEQGDFANEYGSPKCLVKLGCWGPVVNCNVTKRGWMAGIGGCPNVGGICIGCTMPGFPDKFMPFMDEPPGGVLSSTLVSVYGRMIRGFAASPTTPSTRSPSGASRPRADDGVSSDDLWQRQRAC